MLSILKCITRFIQGLCAKLYFLSNYIFFSLLDVTVFRTVDIVKDCSWAMLSLNMLMYSQIIKIFCSCSEYAKFLYFTN